MPNRKKRNPVLKLEKTSLKRNLPVKPEETKKHKKSKKQNLLVKQEEKEKLVEQNAIFKQENVKKKYPIRKQKAENVKKKYPVHKEKAENVKKKYPVRKEKAVEISQNKEKSQVIDICDTDSESTVHLTQKDYTVVIKLRKEFKNENGLIEYACQICEEKHYSEESFTRHWYLHTVYDPRITCVVCAETIKRRRKFKSHVAQKHASHPYRCSVCSLLFKGAYEDKCHKLGHAQMCNYFCSICGIGFEVFHALEFHMFTAHVEGCKGMYSIDQDLVNTLFVKMELEES